MAAATLVTIGVVADATVGKSVPPSTFLLKRAGYGAAENALASFLLHYYVSGEYL
jgi:hypothetical protein